MPKTWKRRKSNGKYFRNCPMIAREQDRAITPWKFWKLQAEYDTCSRNGTIEADKIGCFDRWVEYDDSPEATQEWANRFLRGERW